MSSLEDKQRHRLEFLRLVYEAVNGNMRDPVSSNEIGQKIGISWPETRDVVQYLEARGLIRSVAVESMVFLEHAGQLEIEQVKEHPEQGTRNFPASIVQNIINIGSMNNSQVQQGSHGSTQSLSLTGEQSQSLRDALPGIREAMLELPLDEEDRREVEAELGTLDHQVASPKPKVAIAAESLNTLKSVALRVGGAAIAAKAIGLLAAALGGL